MHDRGRPTIQNTQPSSSNSFTNYFVPILFVVLWSTGFIGAKFGLPYAEPFTFLAIRMAITLCVLLPVVLLFVKKWMSWSAIGHSMFTGILIHACYLGAVFYAISQGMSAGVSSLVVALQPLLTSFIAWFMLGERISMKKIAALSTALVGVMLVLSPRITGGAAAEGITTFNIVCIFFSVVAISFGTVYQKKFVPKTDLRASAAAQYFGALIPMALFSFLSETREVVWSGEFIFALFWLVFILSIGAVSLLMFLIRRDSAAQTASLFYLVPVSTAIIAYFVFGEKLSLVQIVGMFIVVGSVAYASRQTKK
ncbi:MAG: DMT family transporter [Salaquimonas sp.]